MPSEKRNDMPTPEEFEALSELAKVDRAEFARRMTEICMGPDPGPYEPRDLHIGIDWARVAALVLAAFVIAWVVVDVI